MSIKVIVASLLVLAVAVSAQIGDNLLADLDEIRMYTDIIYGRNAPLTQNVNLVDALQVLPERLQTEFINQLGGLRTFLAQGLTATINKITFTRAFQKIQTATSQDYRGLATFL